MIDLQRAIRIPERERVPDDAVHVSADSGFSTNRLSLVSMRRRHAPILHEHATEAVTRLWIGWDTPSSQADTEASVADALSRGEAGAYAGWLARCRFRDSTGATPFVGFVSLERLPEPMRGAWFELNFWLAQSQWGKGYAYEMAAVVLDWVASHTDLRYVTMSWTHGNERSRSVIERLVQNQHPLKHPHHEVHPATKNGVELPVYHYVLDVDAWYRKQSIRRRDFL